MNAHDAREGRLLNALCQVSGLLAAGFGFVALLGWVLALPLLSSFGAHLKPMSPSTALLFGLLGTAVFFRVRSPLRRGAHWMGIVIGCLSALVALVLFFLSYAGTHLDAEYLGIPVTGTLKGMPIGHMSPLTALLFVVASSSFLASLSSSSDRPRRATVALCLTYPIIAANCVLALAYFVGMPILYGTNFIPPALPTSMAFMALGIAPLTFARTQPGPPGELIESANTRASHALLVVFVTLTLGIVTTAYLYYHKYEEQYKVEVMHELSAIGELKVG